MTDTTPPDSETERRIDEILIKFGRFLTGEGGIYYTYHETKAALTALIAEAETRARVDENESLVKKMQSFIDSAARTVKRANKSWDDGGFPIVSQAVGSARLGWIQAQRLLKKRLAELSATRGKGKE